MTAFANIPNRIALISRGRHEEYPANSGNVYPGHLLYEVPATSPLAVDPHNVVGGGGPVLVAEEDALQGGTNATAYVINSPVSVRVCAKGDKMLLRLTTGQSVTAGQPLMSNGDGTVTLNAGNVLYEITAPSTVITNLGTETAFSNGSYAIPANTLQVGDVIRVQFKVFCIAENSTNTHRIRLYLGASPITLADSTALQLAAGDVVICDLNITVRSITASGTIVADGFLSYSVSGTFTDTGITVASTTLDSTVAETLVIKSLASATSTGNQIRLDEFRVSLAGASGPQATVAVAQEAVNNTGGTTPFIRSLIV
jgi:hypothetical protein